MASLTNDGIFLKICLSRPRDSTDSVDEDEDI